jgi:hypothetical protein
MRRLLIRIGLRLPVIRWKVLQWGARTGAVRLADSADDVTHKGEPR